MFVVKLVDDEGKFTYVYETYSRSEGRTLITPNINTAKKFQTKSGAMSCGRSRHVAEWARECGYTSIQIVEVK